MGRTVAVIWHALFSLAAAGLYFFFVLPRWPELMGQTSPTLGLALRILTAVLIGVAALPVVFTYLRTRRPEFGTPELALRLRVVSIALHVLAGVLILGAAISEIWLSLDTAGQWLFGIYGAAAAIALLGIFSFYLAFVAEVPPPAPKPLKTKEKKSGRGRNKADEAESDEPEAVDETEEADAPESEDEPAQVSLEKTESTAEEAEPVEAATTRGKLRNRRPTAKGASSSRVNKRSPSGVAVED